MKYLGILVIVYALWRIYRNYKSSIRNTAEISLIVGGLISLVGNHFFKDSLIGTICQLGLITLVTFYIGRQTTFKEE